MAALFLTQLIACDWCSLFRVDCQSIVGALASIHHRPLVGEV